MAPVILIVDRDQEEREALEQALGSLGHKSVVTADSEKVCALLRSEHPSLLLCDIGSLSGNGSLLFSCLREIDPQIPIVAVADLGSIGAAAQAVRDGALYYLLRPLTQDNLKLVIERGLEHSRNASPAESSKQQSPTGSAEIIAGTSHAMQRVLELASRVAKSDANIIIFGESGTGKELFAKVIHACSRRSAGVFIPVDCASLPENLLEAELFGYEKGAFTGAINSKPGLMEMAHGGTLFFDEIAELPISLQPKLLRALQERQHRRLGGTRIINFDVRVVSATNRDLPGLVAQRQFRQDLFYRLNVVPLHLPPLRARDSDVVLLANHFLKECGRKSLSAPKRFTSEVLGLLEGYSWPGNVRELQNVVEYSCAVAQTDTVTVPDLPENLRIYDPQAIAVVANTSPPLTFRVAKARFESNYAKDLLRRHGDNISEAARVAGVDRKTFYSLLQKHNIVPTAESPNETRMLRRL
jgi:two-component system, NtrC family, response regulator HydG